MYNELKDDEYFHFSTLKSKKKVFEVLKLIQLNNKFIYSFEK